MTLVLLFSKTNSVSFSVILLNTLLGYIRCWYISIVFSDFLVSSTRNVLLSARANEIINQSACGEGLSKRKKLSLCSKLTKNCIDVYKSKINVENVRPFCNRHFGKSALLLGTGPTLKDFLHRAKEKNFNQVITAGVNSIIYSGIPIDYLFIFDKGKRVYRGKRGSGWLENPENFDSFECRIQKFYGYFRSSPSFGPPVRSNSGAKVIEGSHITNAPLPLNKEIGYFQFGASTSTIFHALQFLLYTGVKKIYIIGCDGGAGYVELPNHSLENLRNLKEMKSIAKEWKVAYEFIAREYPNVNVSVLNPVGLKGIGWKEIYDTSEIFT